MNRWAIVAIPLLFCLALMETVVRQCLADRAFHQSKKRLAKYEKDCALYVKAKKDQPPLVASLGGSLEKAVKLEPDCAEYRNYLARYYQARATDPDLSEAERTMLVDQAIEQHEKAVALDPLNGVYLAYLAWMQGVTGHREQALENFEKAVELNKSNGWIKQIYETYREQSAPPKEPAE